MTFDIQAAVVSPFNGLKKRLSEWLANSSPASSDLPPAMKHLAPQGSVSSLVAPALSADLLRIICDSGFVSLGLDPNPERTALVMPLASALLKQLPGQQQSQGLSAFISDVGPFGYRCGLTKWVGARLCTKAAAATSDETFLATYLSILRALAALVDKQGQVSDVSQVIADYRNQRPLEKGDGLPETVVNSLGMRLRLIQPGEFIMGKSLADADADYVEEMPHEVRITKPFYFGAHQVTQQQYEQVIGENPSMFRGRFRPVEHLRWQDAVEFCRRLSELPAEQEAGREYRLPTEAEWEYACRADTTTSFNTGDSLDASQACIRVAETMDGFSKPTRSVGSYPANQWGLYDMHGNVWEWCEDWFGREYYAVSRLDDPRGPECGTHHVLRGGAASSVAALCTSSSRGEAFLDGPSFNQRNAIAWYGDLGMRAVCVTRSANK